jgi:hypothetical protein
MAVEAKRGCGYRKVGGMYLVTFGAGQHCGKMPIRCDICPTCHGGIKPSRGWTWIDPVQLFGERECLTRGDCGTCPVGDHRLEQLGPIGLIWVGETHYPTPHSFTDEAKRMGISRRIKAIPKGYQVGETWIAFAHRKVKFGPDAEEAPGIFYFAQPMRIEKVVTASQSEDLAEMDKPRARGITPVIVPDDDPDHNPAVGKEEDLDQLDMFETAA